MSKKSVIMQAWSGLVYETILRVSEERKDLAPDDYEGQLDAANELLEVNPFNTGLMIHCANLLVLTVKPFGLALIKGSRVAEAEELYRGAIAIEPDNIYAKLGLANLIFNTDLNKMDEIYTLLGEAMEEVGRITATIGKAMQDLDQIEDVNYFMEELDAAQDPDVLGEDDAYTIQDILNSN